MSRQAEIIQIVICFLVFGSIYEDFRQEKLGMKWLCINQSFFSFIIPYLVFSKDRRGCSSEIITGSPAGAQTPPNGADANTDANEGSAKEGEVEDADFEVVEEEK